MDLNKYFKIGDRIQIVPKNREKKHEYISQIAGIYDGYMDVLNPIYKSSLVYFRNDELLSVVIPKKEAVYEFKSKVTERSFGKVSLLRLKILSELNRVQRRDYYRLKITRTIELKKINTNKKEEENNGYYEGILADISGGGVLFFSKLELNLNDLIKLKISLDENKTFELNGIIKRKEFNIEKSFLYEYGAEFKNMKRIDRDILIKFIYDEQRKLLKRGLI